LKTTLSYKKSYSILPYSWAGDCVSALEITDSPLSWGQATHSCRCGFGCFAGLSRPRESEFRNEKTGCGPPAGGQIHLGAFSSLLASLPEQFRLVGRSVPPEPAHRLVARASSMHATRAWRIGSAAAACFGYPTHPIPIYPTRFAGGKKKSNMWA
jgi:hypothetical protein